MKLQYRIFDYIIISQEDFYAEITSNIHLGESSFQYEEELNSETEALVQM